MADTTRHLFGLTLADYVQLVSDDGVPVLQGGVPMQFWVDRTGDTAYVDLAADQAGDTLLDTVTTSAGGNGYQFGDVTSFYGPPGRKWMFASAGDGPRRIMFCSDLAEIVDKAILDDLVQARGDLLAGFGAGAVQRLPIGTNGRLLTADDTQETGMRWALPPGGSGVSGVSDMLWVAASNAPDDFGDGDYNCDGVNDHVEINAALSNAFGLRVGLSPGTFQLGAPVLMLGNDDAAAPLTRVLRGAGAYTSTLVAGAGLAAAIFLSAAVCPLVSDLGIVVAGATHGIYSVASASGPAGKRSFWHGDLRNIAVKGPNNGTHTGWGMSLGAGWRFTVNNMELTGLGNGVRLLNQDATFNAGAAEFRRVAIELIGTGAVAVHVSSPVGGANQVVFDTVTASVASASTGTVGWKFDGAGATSGVRVRNSTAELFDTAVVIGATAYDIDVDLTHVSVPDAGTALSVAGYNCRLRVGQLYVAGSFTVTAVNETNALGSKPNQFELDIVADTAASVTATLLTGVVNRGVASGAGTVAGILKQIPQRGGTEKFGFKGTVTATGPGDLPVYNDSGVDRVLKSARYSLGVACSSGISRIDINVSGASIFSNPANRPTIAATTTTSGRVTTGVQGVIWPAGTPLTVDIDDFGTGGADPAAQIDWY